MRAAQLGVDDGNLLKQPGAKLLEAGVIGIEAEQVVGQLVRDLVPILAVHEHEDDVFGQGVVLGAAGGPADLEQLGLDGRHEGRSKRAVVGDFGSHRE